MRAGNTPRRQEFVSDSGSSVVLASASTIRLADYVLGPRRVRYSLLAAMGSDRHAREVAVWETVFLRSSTIPADAIFSTMGLLGITLDPQPCFSGPNGRLAATIRLAQTYLAAGGKAHWLSLLVGRAQDAHNRQFLYYRHEGWGDQFDDWPLLDRRMCTIPH